MSSNLSSHSWHLMSAVEVVEALKSRRVTPLELIDVVETRLKETDHLLHTTPITCFDRARKAARSLVCQKSPKPGYLYGLPILIKDCHAVSGVRYTEGSPLHKNRIPENSDPIVLQLEEMGGIVVGKTNTPEFCAGSHSFNTLFETTRSPYDTRTSAGGSSGGSAAALAGTQVWLATGSDLGGSLRIPAAFCGVVGFRCTPGRIPRELPDSGSSQESKQPYHLYAVNGPLARNVPDLALFLDSMTSNKSMHGGTAVGWEGYPIPPPISSPSQSDHFVSWQAVAQRGMVKPRHLRIGYSNLGLPVSEIFQSICKDAAHILANTMCNKCEKSFVSSSSERSTIHESNLIDVETCFDFSVAERCFHVFRADSFHKWFTVDYTKEEISTMKPEIQWNIACHLIGNNPKTF